MSRTGERVGIGIIGAGYISSRYLENLTTRFDNVAVLGVADLMEDRAREQGERFGVQPMTVAELLAHPEIEIVVNLTIPAAHAEVAFSVIEAGKSVYNEKPLAATREDAQRILEMAEAKGVLVGGAPDTFLGAGYQTARKLLDEGAIGTPVAANAMLLLSGHERWHPNPDFYYQPGGGPMFDMGPYYLAALLSLLGPVKRVAAMSAASFATRTIASGPRAGETIPVDTPTHIATLLDFVQGAKATLTTTFDVHDTNRTTVVLYGSEGSMRLPDPNFFGGPVEILHPGAEAWEPIDLIEGVTDDSRGIGVSDMAAALREGRTPRASGELGFHIVDVMYAALESAGQEQYLHIESTIDRPEPLGELAGSW
jgi:predicted dehydrogenase